MALTFHITFLGLLPNQHFQGITSSACKSYLRGNPFIKSGSVSNLKRTLSCSCRSRSTMTEQKAEKNYAKSPHVLSVAGSDSGAGAGIQADMKACGALGVYCSTVITAVTAQNTVGVQGVHPVPENFVFEQLKSVLSDMEVDVVKTGMLPSTGIIQALCRSLKEYPVRALVIDPVMVATSGDVLASPDIISELRREILPMSDIITPNLKEASALIGGEPLETVDDMCAAAKSIHQLGPRYVLVKGGHLRTVADVVDILYDGETYHELRGPRIQTHNTHGTGCSLASCIAAELAKGSPMLPSVLAAKRFIEEALEHSQGFLIGNGPQGPFNHLFKLSYQKTFPVKSMFKPNDLLLYAVTDSGMNKKWGRSISETVRAAIEGGATIVQLREKEADTKEIINAAEECLKVSRSYGLPLLINDRIDVALVCNADGVHLGQSDMPVKAARALLGPNKIIGASCKTPEQAQKAWEEGADYIGAGGVYPTNTKKNNLTIGLHGLQRVCESSLLPVVAIGGINAENAHEVMGMDLPKLMGVAVVSCLFNKENIYEETHKLRSALAKYAEIEN